jgi:hypothetical protein
MSEFEFFFAFYGMVLGLAAAEVLNGVGGMVRDRRVTVVGWQTAMLTALVMVGICVTWIDAWESLRGVDVTLEALAAPLGIAGCYYLAAVTLFPQDIDEWASLDAYFAERKRYTAAFLLGAGVLVSVTYLGKFIDALANEPHLFWGWLLPYNLLIIGLLIALILVRGRRWNIAVMAALIVVLMAPYWAGSWSEFLVRL